MLSSAARTLFWKLGFCIAFPKPFVEFLIVQAILFRIFWAFVAVFIDKNDFLNFFPFHFHSHSYLYRKGCEAELRLCVTIWCCLSGKIYQCGVVSSGPAAPECGRRPGAYVRLADPDTIQWLINVGGAQNQLRISKNAQLRIRISRKFAPCSGADLGGDALSSGIRPPADPMGPPLILFMKSIFDRPTFFFLEASLAPNFTNFQGECAPKKRNFLSIFSKKYPKTAFWSAFFSKICRWRKNSAKTGSF